MYQQQAHKIVLLYDKITERLSKCGIILTLQQQEELDNTITQYFQDQESNFFYCGYCDERTEITQGIWEQLSDDIAFYICEQCYMAGIDSV